MEAGRLSVRHTLQRVDGALTLLEPKTERSRRTIALPEVVLTALRAHRTRQKMERLVAGSGWARTDHVFTTQRGAPLDAATVTRSFQRALAAAGLPHRRFHDLRHSAATFLLAHGFTLEDVKNLLGHSSIVLTSNTYGHVLEQRQRQVALGMEAVLGGSPRTTRRCDGNHRGSVASWGRRPGASRRRRGSPVRCLGNSLVTRGWSPVAG